jgi:hypothetical protein
MKFILPAAVLFATLGLLLGCERPEPGSEHTDRSERHDGWDDQKGERSDHEDEDRTVATIAQSRVVENFDSIEMHVAAAVVIKVGPAASLSIDADDRTLKYLETRVKGDKLYIDVSKKHSWNSNQSHLKITVTLPALKSLEADGAGDIEITGLNGGDQELELSGLQNIRAEGHLDKLKLKISGAGNVNYKKVIVANARVTVNGAGNVELHTTDSLHAEVNGVGMVTYTGNPSKVESELHGLGSIGRADKSTSDENTSDEAKVKESKDAEQKAEGKETRTIPASPPSPPAPPRP